MKKIFSIFVAVLISVAMWGTTYTVAGNSSAILGDSWKPALTANDMTLVSNNNYKLVKTGLSLSSDVALEFKVCVDHGWGTAYPSDNYSVTIPAGTTGVAFYFNSSSHDVDCFFNGRYKFTVVGDAAIANSKNWDNDAAVNQLTSTDGENYTLSITNLELTTGIDYGFKIVEKGSWSEYYPKTGDNATLSVSETAIYTITYSYNAITKSCIVTKTKTGEIENPAKFFITGDSALVVDAGLDKSKAWNANAIKSETDSYTIEGLKANVKYQLKVVTTNTEWKGFSDLTGTPATGLYTDNGGNIYFRLASAGNVTVTYTSTAFTLSGSFKAVPLIDLNLIPSIWDTESPKYAAWTWGADGYQAWTPFFTGSGDTLTTKLNNDADSIIFVRLNSALTEPKWNTETEKDNVWNEAEKTKIDKVGLTYTITGWGEGEDPKSTGTWEAVGKYYITGDSALVVDAGLAESKAWKEDAFKATKDTFVLENLKANQEYNLKIVDNGDWKGYTHLTVLDDGLSTKDDNNIKFTLNTAGNVTVIYKNSGEVFKLIGDFKEPEFDPAIQQRLKLVPHCWSEANAKIAAYTWGKKIEGKWTGFFAGYNESDTLRATIRTAADSIAFVRFASDVEHPSWELEEEEGKVWNKIDKILIDHTGLVYTIVDWSTGTWDSFIPATFYATGDSALVVDAGFDKAKAWNADAIKAIADTLVLKDLKAGQNYMLKVTLDGTWEGENNVKGYDELTEKAEGLLRGSGVNENNICFKLNSAGDVKIVYTSSLFKLIGDFYVKTYETKTVKLVPSEEWLDANAKFAAWTWGAEQDGKWSAFFTPVSEDNDTLQATIKTSADSIDFVRFSPKAAEPSWASKDSSYVLVWNELKDTIDWKGLTASIEGWNTLTWEPVAKPCESYGLTINGVYHAGKKNVMQSSWLEYKLTSVELKKDDVLKVRNDCSDAEWVITTYMDNSFYIPNDGNKYTVESDGTYDFYIKLGDGDAIYISKAGFSTQAVPNQCEDVLMQAFYNESYNDYAAGVSTIGDTRWNSLAAEAEDIRSYFDLVWLPPSAAGDGMGYHPKNYGNQSSNWGTAAELDNLIKTLHGPDPNKIQARVVADIVINHCQSSTGWMGFPEFDFGTYGKFQPVGEWICANDEVNWADGSDAKGQAKGPDDDGENWSGARDWSHSNVDVQNMFKAYLRWMRDVVGYDGFRYDKGDGFDNWHHDNYNKNAGPYIAFMECYSNTDNIWWRIEKANHNLMALDFDTKWHMFDAIAGWDYNGKYDKWRGDGLLGRGLGHYAIEFIDSHDWFLRDDNSNEFGGHGNSLTPALKARLLQANAFLLSMPGVPCVFYPHWKTYPTEIKEMIDARKLAGVHSDSEIRDESATSSGYQATMVGKYGYLILCLGDKAHQDFSANYKLISSNYAENDQNSGHDASYQIWVNRTSPAPAEEYYLVGSKYNWATDASRLFESSGTSGEFVIKGVTFEENELIKVVKVVNNKFKAWYPADNYVISSDEAGIKDIYFRPEAYGPWDNGHIYLATPSTPTGVEEMSNESTIKAEKIMKNGQLFIRMGDKTFDMMGRQIK